METMNEGEPSTQGNLTQLLELINQRLDRLSEKVDFVTSSSGNGSSQRDGMIQEASNAQATRSEINGLPQRRRTMETHEMLVCTLDGDLYPPLEEPAGIVDPKNKKKDKDKEKKFIWNHGITAPLKNVRKRRFRKTAKKKYIESPDVEKEVKRLLSTDLEAVSVRWEVIAEDETKELDNQGPLANLENSSPGTSGHKQGRAPSVEHDELREIFNDISSSSEDEEDEGDRHDDEDLNIMDTEEDLERLQDKMNDSDGQDQEKDRPNQIVLDFQKQIDHLKSKLLETQEKRKRQEDLIMKVENVALKTRLQLALDELKQQEEREKQQLASLNEQLESLLEK